MFKSARSLFVGAALAAGAMSAQAQSQPTGSWPSADSYDTGNGFTVGGSASDGTYLYVLGGYQQGTLTFRRYDPANDSWEDLESLPEDNAYFRAAYVDGHVYIIGNGYYGNGELYRYDIANRTWSGSVAALENARYQAGVAVLGNKMYIAGGYDNWVGGYSAALEVFDHDTGTLTTLADMPTALVLPAGAGVPQIGRVYFAGGESQNGYSAECLEYDPNTDVWLARAQVSNGSAAQPRYSPGGFALNGRFYVVGGYNNGYQSTTLEFTPATNTWAQRANMNDGRYGFAFGVINNEGFVYGGYSNGAYYTRDRFIPPDFGALPDVPAEVVQVGSQPESSDQGGWTNNQVVFQADVTDPDAGQQVRLEIQVRPSASQNWGAILSSGNGAQGIRSVTYAIPANGNFDWRWRVADALGNYAPTVNGVPAWVEAFGNDSSPDLRSDQVAPSAPVALTPANVDVQVNNAAGGPVTLTWTEATDNGPASAIRYEIQVSTDGGFNGIEAQLTANAGETSADVTLAESRYDKFWRLRARDIGGNIGPWSNVRTFRVTFNDGEDHAAGDADKGCGFGASAAFGSTAALLLGLAVLAAAAAAGRRMIPIRIRK